MPIALPGVLVERLQGIDARLTEIDGALTALVEVGATGLAEPGVAARVSERAALAQERLAAISGLVTDIGTWMQEARERLAVQERRLSRALNVGALVASVGALFFAGLNVLLFQQGRRWSQRGPARRLDRPVGRHLVYPRRLGGVGGVGPVDVAVTPAPIPLSPVSPSRSTAWPTRSVTRSQAPM